MKNVFSCECSGELLRIEKIDDNPTEYWIALYRLGNYNPSIKNRIKWAWKILKTGRLHEDQITLSEESVKELRDYLNEL